MAGQSNEQHRIIQLFRSHQCRHHHHAVPKPRLLWTPQLHASFLDAIDQLGGPTCATPKNILKVMKIEGLTRQQVKSHLQNTRLEKIKKLEKLGNDGRTFLGFLCYQQEDFEFFDLMSMIALHRSRYVEGNLSEAPGTNFGYGNNQGSEKIGPESWIKMTPGDVAAQLFHDLKNAPVVAEAILQQKTPEIASAMNSDEGITNAPSVYNDFWKSPEHDDNDLLISHQAKKRKTFFLSSDDEHPDYSLRGPSHQPPLSTEWRWEGTIAKKGIPICRACCFPVGISTDIMLPEVLNIVARTSLETVAEQYYHAAGAWVVFFAPESEADIGLYNYFMHSLEGKRRAEVAELDATTALFLVPPSEFSEKVLKIPGTSRISGVIIRFGHRDTHAGLSSLPHPHGDIPYPPPTSSSGDFLVDSSFPGNFSVAPPLASISGSTHAAASTAAETTNENLQDYMMLNQQNPDVLPTYSLQNVASDAAVAGPSSSMPAPAAALQSEQITQSEQIFALQNNYQLNSGLSSSFQFDKVQQQQQGSNVPQTSGAQENDPHTLLQAASQLAAGLLLRIQQKEGN